ncbi:MAG: cytochrome c oxidase subunit II [Planctomycetota bacterium]
MKLQAFLLSLLLGLAGAGIASASGAAAQDGSAANDGAADDAAAPASVEETGIDVDAVIAEYNDAAGTSRKFTAEEREWIGAGLAPGDVDAAHKGYVAIPSGDPNLVIVARDGKRIEVRSNPDTLTPPAAEPSHMLPFAPEVDEGTFWMPVAASETAKEVDLMFNFIMWTCYIFTALIGVLMVVFCIKYRRRPGVKADQSHTHNTPLEITWSVIPTILVAIMFWGGYVTFLDMRTPPPDAMKINVNAYRWGWDFTYQNGAVSPQEFHVPENTPIEMVMTSSDVLHSFHLPSFRQKSDVLPNRYTKVWFESGEPAVYRVYCTEYCGKAHSNMYAKLVVEPREDYEAWLTKTSNWMLDENGEMLSPLEIGTLTYTRRACKTCHSIDGTAGTGPTFAGLWGLERKFGDGTSAVADENYIRQSILEPYSQLVEGYGKQMTVYNPMLPEEQISGIIAFIQSLEDVPRKD